MRKSDLCGEFGSDLMLKGVVAVPRLLLHNYTRLGLREGELVLLLILFSISEKGIQPENEEIAEQMGIEREQVEQMLGRLKDGKLIELQQESDHNTGTITVTYCFSGLMKELSEIWAQDKANKIERNKTKSKQISTEANDYKGIKPLFRAFEQEFGRPLTEIECNNIIEWHEKCGFPQDLIFEALKRAVMNQTTNWRYINSILREWDKKNLRSLKEILEDDAKFKARQNQAKGTTTIKKKTGKTPTVKDKYKDFYL